jgi:hypothetical protein
MEDDAHDDDATEGGLDARCYCMHSPAMGLGGEAPARRLAQAPDDSVR